MAKKKMHSHFSAEELEKLTYRDVDTLRRFISSNMKIVPRRRSGLTAKQQRKVAKCIKQARIAGLLSFVPK